MKRVRNRCKASTIMLICAMIIFALAATGIYSALTSMRSFDSLEENTARMAAMRSALKDYQAITLSQRNDMLLYSATLDKRYHDMWYEEYNKAERTSLANELRNLKISEKEEKMLEELIAIQDAATKLQLEVFSIEKEKLSGDGTEANLPASEAEFSSLTKETANLISAEDYRRKIERADELFDALQEGIIHRITEERGGNQDWMQRSLMMDVTILGCILIMIVVLYIALSSKLIRPLQTLENHFGKLADGDLHTQIPLEEDTSEVGQLVVSANSMQSTLSGIMKEIDVVLYGLSQGNLKQNIGIEFVGDFVKIRDSLEQIAASYGESFAEINNAAYEVSNGSEQIAMNSQSLSEGAIEQASTIEELAATFNEVSARIVETLESAEDIKLAAVEMTDVIKAGGDSMSMLTTTMKALNKYSAEIYKIVKTIDNIAFQTNILALNASVEAARAEQYGASFSVVADEVRALAAQSAQSAQATAKLIEETINAIKSGVECAGETESALTKIIDRAGNVQDRVVTITTAMESDSHAVQQALTSLEQLSAVVQANTASAEETAAASEEIAAQATAVVELVKKFK